MHWGWLQFVIAGMMIWGSGCAAARYGQPKRDSYDLVDMLFGPILLAWLLYMGGFWS